VPDAIFAREVYALARIHLKACTEAFGLRTHGSYKVIPGDGAFKTREVLHVSCLRELTARLHPL